MSFVITIVKGCCSTFRCWVWTQRSVSWCHWMSTLHVWMSTRLVAVFTVVSSVLASTELFKMVIYEENLCSLSAFTLVQRYCLRCRWKFPMSCFYQCIRRFLFPALATGQRCLCRLTAQRGSESYCRERQSHQMRGQPKCEVALIW